MINRLTTSIEIESKIVELQKLLKLSTKAAVMRIAIGVSLQINDDPREKFDKEIHEHNGATYQRNTITGENDELYKALLLEQTKGKVDENEIFPDLMNAHIARGVDILYDEYQLLGNYDKMLDYIFSLM